MNPRTCAVLASLGLLGCSSGNGPNGAIALSIGTLPTVTAGDSLPVEVHALTLNNVTLQLVVVRITGVFNVIDSVSLHAVGETLFVHSYLVPPQTPPGGVTVKVTARGGIAADSQEATVTILPHAYTSISFASLGGVFLIPLPAEPTLGRLISPPPFAAASPVRPMCCTALQGARSGRAGASAHGTQTISSRHSGGNPDWVG